MARTTLILPFRHHRRRRHQRRSPRSYGFPAAQIGAAPPGGSHLPPSRTVRDHLELSRASKDGRRCPKKTKILDDINFGVQNAKISDQTLTLGYFFHGLFRRHSVIRIEALGERKPPPRQPVIRSI